MSACLFKHTKFQPSNLQWRCPNCGHDSDKGFVIDDGPNMDCDLVHEDDEVRCTCGYVDTGKKVAERIRKKHNMIPCPTCKGDGHVKGKT